MIKNEDKIIIENEYFRYTMDENDILKTLSILQKLHIYIEERINEFQNSLEESKRNISYYHYERLLHDISDILEYKNIFESSDLNE